MSVPRQLPVINPFDVSRPYAVVMRIALGLALIPGLSTGLLLVLVAGARLPIAIPWPQLAQAHGQVQAIGFVLLFIIAVALQLFPRFLAAPLRHSGRAAWGGGTVALALVARLIAQPLPPGAGRTSLLIFAALGVPAGAILAGSAFHDLSRGRASSAAGTAESWRRFVAVGGLALGTALALYVWSGLGLAAGEVVVPQSVDEALIHLELAGFATCMAFAVASRIFGRFLLLRTRATLEARIPLLAILWGVGLALVALGWLLAVSWAPRVRLLGSIIELAVLVTWLWLIGLYNQPSRDSGTPYVTNPTRRWVRLAFVFLVVSVALDVALFGLEVLQGMPPAFTELSAARHALGQGFLLPLMVAMAARLLPIISADVLKHRVRLELTVDLLLLGAFVRVAAEAIGGYGTFTGPLVALGGALGVVGFAVFSVSMWSSVGRLPKA